MPTRFGFGVATGRRRQRRVRRPLPDELRRMPAVSQQRERHVHRHHGRRAAPANQPGFGVSAAFLDYDRDGALDLYVGNNVTYRGLDKETVCPNPAGARDYCPPQIYGGFPDRLFHNDGKGHFTDVSAKALPGLRPRPALGISTADFDGDGWIDIYVANDGEDNLLWLNQKNGTFKEVALASGARGDGRRQGRGEHGRRCRRLRQRWRRRPRDDRADEPGLQSLRERRRRALSRPGASRPGSVRRARRTLAGAPPGSTTTTTGGWTCSRPTARSSCWKATRTCLFPTISIVCCSGTSETDDSRT